MKEDISLSLLAANHPHLNERELSAESDALVDRMCSILTEDPLYDSRTHEILSTNGSVTRFLCVLV